MRAALVTGASGGLGGQLAWLLASHGWRVVATGRGEDAPLGSPGEWFRADLRRRPDVDALALECERRGVEAVFHCAGVRRAASLFDCSAADVEDQVRVGLLAPILLTRALWPAFERQRSGAVVLVGSLAGSAPGRGETAYGAAKGGLAAFARALQWEAAEIGVRVLHVVLGATRTDMTAGRDDWDLLVDPAEAASVILAAVEAPPSLRVSEITINRRRYR